MKNQKKLNDKRTLVLDAMEKLLSQPDGDHASISLIAKTAGIGKGSVYYYFHSRDEIINELITRVYSDSITRCQMVLLENELNAIEKIEKVITIYAQIMTTEKLPLIQYIYKEENAILRQKTKEQNIRNMLPLLTRILEQGINEKIFRLEFIEEFSEYFLSLMETCFYYLLFQDNIEKNTRNILALEQILESSLHISKGSFHFLSKILIKTFCTINQFGSD